MNEAMDRLKAAIANRSSVFTKGEKVLKVNHADVLANDVFIVADSIAIGHRSESTVALRNGCQGSAPKQTVSVQVMDLKQLIADAEKTG